MNLLKYLPSEFVQRIKEIYPPSISKKVLNSFLEKKNVAFRINTLKADRLEVLKSLQKKGFKLCSVDWYKDAFILKNRSLKELQKTEEFIEGAIYIQNLSSMIPPLVLEPKEGELILDLCAAPGSKTTQLAVLTKNKAKIFAVEKIKSRFFKLLRNLEHQGVNCVKPLLLDGVIVHKKVKMEFDKILLDAPCSAEGLFYVYEPRTFKYWKMKKVRDCAHKQKRLLISALRLLKPQGTLVYSTCTFSPEENEAVIDFALKKFKGEIICEEIDFKIPNRFKPLIRWKQKEFLPQVEKAVRVIPDKNYEGFFICKMKKV